MNVQQKARELASAITGTREFMDLKQAKAAIDSKSEIKGKMEDFLRRQSELYTSNIPEREARARMAELEQIFGNLSQIPEISRYLEAEKRFGEMMASSNKAVNDFISAHLGGK